MKMYPPMDEVLKAYNLPGVHPAANLFPLMEGEEFDALCESIGKEGLEQDIVLTHEGLLLDGRNRLRACYVTGQLERFKWLHEIYANGYVGYAVRLNIHRRHLSPSVRAAIAVEALPMYEAEAKAKQVAAGVVGNVTRHEKQSPVVEIFPQPAESAPQARDHKEQSPVKVILPEPAKSAPKARDIAADEFKANPRYVQAAKKIKQEAPEVFKEVKSGKITIPQANRKVKAAKDMPSGYITLDAWKGNAMTEVPKVASDKQFNRQSDNNEDSMGNIEWAAWSWNPVTGCKHDCSYCYARDIAQRFYPQGFEPTLHPDRLAAPYNTKVPACAKDDIAKRNVFANSMSDLYGRWVPQEWIDAVFKAMADNPQWNFLTLTKFPKRAAELVYPKNVWIGTSVDLQVRVKPAEEAFSRIECGVRWLSIEPMLEPLTFSRPEVFDWVVIGGASKSNKTPEWIPPSSWIVRVASQFLDANPKVKIYLKTNGRPREFPGSINADTAPEAFRYLGQS